MKTRLKNDYISVELESFGAELQNLKTNDGTEYIWQAQKDIWGRHAPILFPIVGRLKDDSYEIENVKYSLTQHGFARDSEFRLSDLSQNKAVYTLSSDPNTIKKYPYNFLLEVSYEIFKTSVKVSYRVINTDKSVMYFSIGAHPGFNCPILAGETMEDYFLEFDKKETAGIYLLKDGYLTEEKRPFLNNENKIMLSAELFREDALIFKGLSSEKVSLKTRNTDKHVTVDFNSFPYLGIWSKPSGAPFVCIEPWFGVADKYGEEVSFSNKEGIMTLGTGKEFKCSFTISI